MNGDGCDECRGHRVHHDFNPMDERGMGARFGVRRGEFRFLILIALSDKPMHGYALIQEIGKTYQRPTSAGLVYPTLQELQDMGYVVSEENEGKKVYSITAKGREYLANNAEIISRLKAGREYAWKMGEFSFMEDIRDIQAMLMMNAKYLDKEKMIEIQEILKDTKRKIAAITFK
ncbi:MAG: PadR family transcriptional regulator [Nitrososphaerota archaeon]|nr:PadR family transcriptional regulator [Nitrososphaerota archaeon]MDG7045306.1 PadR family transcriptional regulator [Nitrososphaerota archaeon]